MAPRLSAIGNAHMHRILIVDTGPCDAAGAAAPSLAPRGLAPYAAPDPLQIGLGTAAAERQVANARRRIASSASHVEFGVLGTTFSARTTTTTGVGENGVYVRPSDPSSAGRP